MDLVGGGEEESRITGFWLDSWGDGWCYLLRCRSGEREGNRIKLFQFGHR